MPAQALKPTLFIGVPRVFDKVYDGVQARLKNAPLSKRIMFALALWYKWRNICAGYRWDEVRTHPEGAHASGQSPGSSLVQNGLHRALGG